MAIAGSWAAGAITPAEYAGATRWGTGVNPIHAVPEGIPRGPSKLPLGSTADDAYVPEDIVGPVQWGYAAEDAQYCGGEDYRYLREDHPNWGEDSTGRADRDGRIMEVGVYPQPEGWPAWGPANDSDPTGELPLPGPTGGAAVRAQNDEVPTERRHAIAVPTGGVTGGWLNKAHGPVLDARDSAPSQLVINTSAVQYHKPYENTRARARGTDDRQAIEPRMTGMKVKEYGKSFRMGGGPGTPDMFPREQDLPFRPWFYRQGAMPPPPDTTRGTMSYFDPVLRTPPADTGQDVTAPEAPQDGYGYTDGDYYA